MSGGAPARSTAHRCPRAHLCAPLLVPLLPAEEEREDASADFFVGLLVPAGSPVVQRTVAEAGLQEAEGLTLVSVK